jgi:D-citramalate synthase
MKKLLSKHGVPLPDLLDFEVRIPRGGKTSALTEATITWDLGSGETLRTRGVHSNQVFAAMKATIRMLNLQIQKSKSRFAEREDRNIPDRRNCCVDRSQSGPCGCCV